MSENRTARNEAWITSLVLHVALLAGIIAVVGLPREQPAGPVAIASQVHDQSIGMVTIGEPVAASVAVMPATAPVQPPTPVQPPPPPVVTAAHSELPSAMPVQPAEHREPVPIAPTATSQSAPPQPAIVSQPSVVSHPAANAAGSPSPPLPAGAATAFFGVPAVGKSVMFVLDRSASMGLDGRLDRARRELAASLRRLPPTARFQVIAYNKAADPVRLLGCAGLLPATPNAVEAVIAAVERLPAEGGSEHAKALIAAIDLGPDVIYFLTDEDDLESRDVLAVTRHNRGRVSIHALCLVPPGGGESPMQRLARDNRGLFQVVK
jgi:hypothetical protein